jgi:hypothetical protein
MNRDGLTDLQQAIMNADAMFPNISPSSHYVPLAVARAMKQNALTELQQAIMNVDGVTELHQAMFPNNRAAVKALIAGGEDINAKSERGVTVLQYAVSEHDLDVISAKKRGRYGDVDKLLTGNKETIKPLWENGVQFERVTKGQWNSITVGGLPTALNLAVDSALHKMGFIRSEIDWDIQPW